MAKLFVPTFGASDWRRLLADPEKHWVKGKSALEMAVSWEAARDRPRGIPPQVANALDSHALSRNAELLVGVPEHKVQMAGGGHASQNDLWALLRLSSGTASMAVEAKSGEPFDKYVADWLADANPGSRKSERLVALRQQLGIVNLDVKGIRYQVLHRCASALIEAQRFRSRVAIFLVQSFGGTADEQSWHDFQQFGKLMGCDIQAGILSQVTKEIGVPLLMGWVSCEPSSGDVLSLAI